MNKTVKIDLGADRLLTLASDLLDEHNYIAALKILNKNAVLNGNDEDSFMLYAETFDDMGLYEKCINGWFKYIDYAGDKADFAEAYEGIAVSFMNLGQENFAAFYYNKLLMETDTELTPQNRKEIIDAFLREDKPPLKFAYPPKLADYSEVIQNGVDYMRENKYDLAVAELDKVADGNGDYLRARNLIAMCNVISDRNDEAEQECLRILSRDAGNVQAMTTLAAVKNQQKKVDESRDIALRLMALDVGDSEDLYKIATVCCENGMHEEAYAVLSKLDERFDYDCTILYFKAISAYNSGREEKAIEILDTLLTVYPNAVVADYWHYQMVDYVKKLKNAKKRIPQKPRLDYYYRLPKLECEVYITTMTTLTKLSETMCKRYAETADVSTAVHWCFDEGEGGAGSYELKLLGAACAVKCGFDDTVRDVLLDAFLPDGIKMHILSSLVEQNREDEYGVVICNLFRRVTLVPVSIGKSRKKTFLRAYALAFSRFAMLASDYPHKLAAATEGLYYKLEEEGRLADCRSASALAAAILCFSEINENDLGAEQICALFDTDENKVNKILGKN